MNRRTPLLWVFLLILPLSGFSQQCSSKEVSSFKDELKNFLGSKFSDNCHVLIDSDYSTDGNLTQGSSANATKSKLAIETLVLKIEVNCDETRTTYVKLQAQNGAYGCYGDTFIAKSNAFGSDSKIDELSAEKTCTLDEYVRGSKSKIEQAIYEHAK